MDLIDIYRAFHPKAAEYTFFSNAHGTFSRIDHMLGHKVCLSKCKKIEILSGIFSSHSALRLGVNCKEKNYKKHKHAETKLYATRQQTDHLGNQRGNQKNYVWPLKKIRTFLKVEMLSRTTILWRGESSVTYLLVRFLHFTWNSKMLILIDCEELNT